MTDRKDVESMVDLQRYPISNLGQEESLKFADQCRADYLASGLCVLPGFIRPEVLKSLAREANSVANKAHFCNGTHNAYLTDNDHDLPTDCVERHQERTYVGSVAYDHIGSSGRLMALYQWDPLKDFIGHVLGKSSFHRSEDPLGACSINVFVDGGEHGWHFDESDFTVTLMLQPPTRGGVFEYVPLIRGRNDEKQLVADILSGVRDRVVELPFTPGTLLIFGGRQTIHRVTKVEGEQPRLVPVLCYSERPGMKNSEAVRKLFWGRTGHEAGAEG